MYGMLSAIEVGIRICKREDLRVKLKSFGKGRGCINVVTTVRFLVQKSLT